MPVETQTTDGFRPGDASRGLPRRLRLPLILLPPLLLAALETLHPQPNPTVGAMLDVATWFATFHAIQLALIGLLGLSMLLLTDRFRDVNAWTFRLGLGCFLVFFSAYDTLAGIGTGLAMHHARTLPAGQQDGVLAVVRDWPGVGPVFALSILGTAGWVVAVGALAVSARRQHYPRPVWMLLALAAIFLLGGHPFPAGTLAFGAFFVAALLTEWNDSHRPLPSLAPGTARIL